MKKYMRIVQYVWVHLLLTVYNLDSRLYITIHIKDVRMKIYKIKISLF